MEKLLKQVVNNTEPKRSFTIVSKLTTIVVSDNKTRFKTWFKPPIQLHEKDYEIALINLAVDRANNCFSYSPGANAQWFDIIIPEGSYHVEDISKLIQREIRKNSTMIKQTIMFILKYLLIPTH